MIYVSSKNPDDGFNVTREKFTKVHEDAKSALKLVEEVIAMMTHPSNEEVLTEEIIPTDLDTIQLGAIELRLARDYALKHLIELNRRSV